MPELPEVQTTVDGINRYTRGLKIVDVWTDLVSTKNIPPTTYNKTHIKNSKFFNEFKKKVIGANILKAERRAKNVLIHLSPRQGSGQAKQTILIHMKMTGHLLFGKYRKVSSKSQVPNPKQFSIFKEKPENSKTLHASRSTLHEHWVALDPGPLRDDPFNRFVHFVLTLSPRHARGKQTDKHLVLSDMRKFAKVTLFDTSALKTEFAKTGPEPLDKSFKLKAFSIQLNKRPNAKIKQVLMDQSIVAGIGNIYSDEILWAACIHPLSQVSKLGNTEFQKLWKFSKVILKKGIKFGGDSMSDYRDVNGKRGKFQLEHRAYRLTGKKCQRRGCGGIIKRIIVGGRSAHFCDKHQKLYA